MMYLDLADLPGRLRKRRLWSARIPNAAWFSQNDHLGGPHPAGPQRARPCRGENRSPPGRPDPPADALRYFGNGFIGQLLFLFRLYRQPGETIVAEVTNTPWGEQHCYVWGKSLDEGIGRRHRYRFGKQFHVSPFMDMNDYDLGVQHPRRQVGGAYGEPARGEASSMPQWSCREEITGASLYASWCGIR